MPCGGGALCKAAAVLFVYPPADPKGILSDFDDACGRGPAAGILSDKAPFLFSLAAVFREPSCVGGIAVLRGRCSFWRRLVLRGFCLAAKRKMAGAAWKIATGKGNDKENSKRRAKTAVGERRTGGGIQ